MNRTCEPQGLRLLVVGPLPPPLTGTPVSFEILCEQLESSDEVAELRVVDSSPKWLKQGSIGRRAGIEDFRQAFRIIVDFVRKVPGADVAVIFGSNGNTFTIGPALLVLARIARLPCYFRVFGGSLDWFIDESSPLARRVAMGTLRRFDGLIVQTELLAEHFRPLLGAQAVHSLPGYRQEPQAAFAGPRVRSLQPEPMRVAFFGIIKEAKGILVALDALELLEERGSSLTIDFFGPLNEQDRRQFEKRCADLDTARYGGLIDWREVIPTLRNYDALILPSFYVGEGHPGVVIEAKFAGIPVVATRFRSIPEIVHDGVDGLLIEPEDAHDLADALVRLETDDSLYATVAAGSWSSRLRHGTAEAVARILEIVGNRTA